MPSQEPIFIRQTAEPLSPAERMAWVLAANEAAFAQGAIFVRVSLSDDETLLLFEAWPERPDDQGEPRFQLEE